MTDTITPEQALKNLIRGYVNLLETGRDRIIAAGGDCDPVDKMEASDPYLREARAALAQQTEPLVTYRHKDGTTRFEQYAKDPVPAWAVDVQPVREPDISALSPKVQARIRDWLADGTFVERAIGTMREQERELMKHGIGGDK